MKLSDGVFKTLLNNSLHGHFLLQLKEADREMHLRCSTVAHSYDAVFPFVGVCGSFSLSVEFLPWEFTDSLTYIEYKFDKNEMI